MIVLVFILSPREGKLKTIAMPTCAQNVLIIIIEGKLLDKNTESDENKQEWFNYVFRLSERRDGGREDK